MTKRPKNKINNFPNFLPKTVDRVERLAFSILTTIPTDEQVLIANGNDIDAWATWHYSVEDILSKCISDRDNEWTSKFDAELECLSRKKDFATIEEQKGWTDAIITFKSILTSAQKS